MAKILATNRPWDKTMIHNHHLTSHAKPRMQPRSVKDEDMELLLETASQVSPDEYLLTKRDVAREIAERKREIQRLERLRGFKVVVTNGAIVTCYRSHPTDQKRTFQRGRANQ